MPVFLGLSIIKQIIPLLWVIVQTSKLQKAHNHEEKQSEVNHLMSSKDKFVNT